MTPLANPGSLPRRQLDPLTMEDFRERLIACLSPTSSCHLSALLYLQGDMVAVLSSRAGIELLSTRPPDLTYPSLTPDCPAAHWFEREMAEQWGLHPQGHPWLKPVRFCGEQALVGVTDFFQVDGEDVHEVAVGPVHAGVIEPGHFRFQCYGERVLHLEISLGYQHRGVERAMVGGPGPRSLHYMETLAGDTTVGHTLAYCLNLEALAQNGAAVSPRAQLVRAVALELERLANHVGDLGALAGDVGYLPAASYCGRLRGDFLNLTTALCGSRMGRGWIRPGGVAFDVDSELLTTVRRGLGAAMADAQDAVSLIWRSATVRSRMEETGPVPFALARQVGLVGVAGRASGVDGDVRRDLPWGPYSSDWKVAVHGDGDVFARAQVRWQEMEISADFLASALGQLSQSPVEPSPANPGLVLQPDMVAVALVEGWRGEICHVAVTDENGRLACYKVVDPSFHNWFGLALALRDQQISDFPLCNKSFNLSYCGHDL